MRKVHSKEGIRKGQGSSNLRTRPVPSYFQSHGTLGKERPLDSMPWTLTLPMLTRGQPEHTVPITTENRNVSRGMMWKSLLRSILWKQDQWPRLALSGFQRLRHVQSYDNHRAKVRACLCVLSLASWIAVACLDVI